VPQPSLRTAAILAAALAAPLAFAASASAQQQQQQQQRQTSATRAQVISQADATFARSDTNNDRVITKTEVEAAQARAFQIAQQNIQTRLAQEFTKLDTDKNGQLSLAEFRAAAPQVRPAGAEVSNQVIQRLDSNKDGKISIEEYRAPILAAFNAADLNKDGTVTADERQRSAATRR
jgi:Ca2+-binding EF-hand superfamily protein